jgi:hypothetical protein
MFFADTIIFAVTPAILPWPIFAFSLISLMIYFLRFADADFSLSPADIYAYADARRAAPAAAHSEAQAQRKSAEAQLRRAVLARRSDCAAMASARAVRRSTMRDSGAVRVQRAAAVSFRHAISMLPTFDAHAIAAAEIFRHAARRHSAACCHAPYATPPARNTRMPFHAAICR